MLLVALGLLRLQTEKFNGTFGEHLEFAQHNLRSKSGVHEVATTRVARVTGLQVQLALLLFARN